MADTYTQLYIQFVFAVKFRENLIHESIRNPIEKYLTGIVKANKHKMLSIYCMPDHAHLLIGLNPVQSISSLANDLKSNSSRWINNEKLTNHQFNWQEGYGAFTYDKNRMYTIANYIARQPLHHKKKTFKEEYLELLKEFEVEYKDQYLFEFFN